MRSLFNGETFVLKRKTKRFAVSLAWVQVAQEIPRYFLVVVILLMTKTPLRHWNGLLFFILYTRQTLLFLGL